MNHWQQIAVRWTVIGHVLVIVAVVLSALQPAGCMRKEEAPLVVSLVSEDEFAQMNSVPEESQNAPPEDVAPPEEPEEVIPPPDEPEEVIPPPDEPEEVVPPPDEPEETPVEEPKEEPKDPPKEKRRIKIGPRVTINEEVKVKPPPSTDELLKALGGDANAKASTTSDELLKGMARVSGECYRYWARDGLNPAMPVAVVTVWLGPDGSVLKHKLKHASGVAAMDRSVMAAVAAVKRIPGLTPTFLDVYPQVDVTFIVK